MPQDTAPKAGQGSPHRLPSGALGPTRSKPHLRPPSHPPRPEQPRVCLSRRPHEAEASWDGEHRRTSLREGEGTQEQEGSDRPGPFPPPPPRQHGGAAGPSPCPQRLPPPSPGEPPARRHPQRGRPAPLSRSPPPPPRLSADSPTAERGCGTAGAASSAEQSRARPRVKREASTPQPRLHVGPCRENPARRRYLMGPPVEEKGRAPGGWGELRTFGCRKPPPPRPARRQRGPRRADGGRLSRAGSLWGDRGWAVTTEAPGSS